MATATLRPPASAQTRFTGLDRMLVNGTWQTGRSAEMLDDRDPYTGKTLLKIPLADERDLDDAFRSAAAAQPDWWDELPRERATVIRRAAEIMEERRDELVDWLIRESGSTRIKANIECDLTQAITMEAATFPSRMEGPIPTSDVRGKENHVYRQPVGVVGMISPWNFPLHLSCRSVAPALALGNAVVLKPSSDTPVTGGTLIAKIYEEAGLPAGLLNVVIGRGNEMGDAFVRHPGPRVISFTGSTKVGRRIAELCATASILKRAVLELGGNSPCVILDDADIDLAVRIAVFGKFLHQGQICMATNRLIVDASIYDEFVDRFVARVRSLKVGDPSNADTVIGPVINNQQLANHLEHIDRARHEGATEVVGGKPEGLVLPPHVFVGVTRDMSLAREELFGPIVGIIKVSGDDEALAVANDTEYGLSSAVVTRDVERGERFARRIQAGMTHVNDSPVNDLPTCPFGGEKNSGMGRYNGHWAIDEFTTVHWVSVQHEPIQYPF